VVATVVSLPQVDVEGSRRLAESLGVKFRVREYNEMGQGVFNS